MPGSILYLCEAQGARLFAVGDTIAQVSGSYQLDVTTWDILPAGEMGAVSFRTIDVALNVAGGYSVGITPIIDGVALIEQRFSGPDTGIVKLQAFVAVRGTRIAARVRTLARFGDVELYTIKTAFIVLRADP
jgi:hypothetical protein